MTDLRLTTPHQYSPNPMLMGDCGICGHTAAAHTTDPYAALNQHLHGDGDWPGPGEKPHKYSPDPMMMGDCKVCGHTRSAHDTAWRTRALAAEAEIERLRGMLNRRGVGPAERYWENRWRDEAAENDRLRAERDAARRANIEVQK